MRQSRRNIPMTW